MINTFKMGDNYQGEYGEIKNKKHFLGAHTCDFVKFNAFVVF